MLREPHSGFTDLGFSHSGIHLIRERCINNENGLIFIQEKAKEEDREKLGEKEETIPPDYRLEEAKDKDGKPLLPKEVKEPLPVSKPVFL